jgi:hypothetical protein
MSVPSAVSSRRRDAATHLRARAVFAARRSLLTSEALRITWTSELIAV